MHVTIVNRILPALLVVAFATAPAAVAGGGANIRFDPDDQTVFVGDTVFVDLYVDTDGPGTQAFDALDAVITWDPLLLTLVGSDQSNADALFFVTGFLPDPDGVNIDQTDGEVIFTALAVPGAPEHAPLPPGTLVVTTLEFTAIAPTPGTLVDMIRTTGVFGKTRVLLEGANVTGDTSGTANVTILQMVDVEVTVELAGVWADAGPLSVERCITFDLHETGGTTTTVSLPMTFTSPGPGTAAIATETFTVTELPYDCIAARDTLHTLLRTDDDDFGLVGSDYVADFTDRTGFGGDDDSLIGGNLNDDEVIDILDVGVWTAAFATNYGTGDTVCTVAAPHADVNADGVVDSDDFADFLQANFLTFAEAGCPLPPLASPAWSGPDARQPHVRSAD